MKTSALFAAALLSVAGTAHAYESFQSFSVYYPNTPWVRGTMNNWGKTALVAATSYKYTGVSYVGYVNIPAGLQQLKFDLSTNGDWSASYGDTNTSDNCLDQNGPNIPFTQGAGTYEVRYSSSGYVCNRPVYQFAKLNSFAANLRSLYLRTTFNDWKPLPMFMVKDHVWEAELSAAPNTTGSMKFDKFGDWSSSFGRPAGSDTRSYTNTGYASAINGANLGLYLADSTSAPVVTARIRFDDRTNEFAVCHNTSRPLCR